jgi:hypothetical protein
MPVVIDRRYRTGSNEVETGKYSGSWLIGEVESLWLRVESRGKAHRLLSALNSKLPTGPDLFPAFTPEIVSGIGPGKLYPVTAAQLLPNLTGFLTPLHNCN